ncbi:hypothetical protein GCM10027051_14650 [Niabella terrae]
MKQGIAILAAAFLLLVAVSSCEKTELSENNQPVEAWYLQNNLSVPVYFQQGYLTQDGADRMHYTIRQEILPGRTLAFTGPIPGSGEDSLSTANGFPGYQAILLTINNKTKRDMNCADFPQTHDRQDCQLDTVNFFNNNNKWREVYTPEKDSTTRIYLIDGRDSLEAH